MSGPLTTTEDKASPWKLLAAFKTHSLGHRQEQLYLFPEVLSHKQGLRKLSAWPPPPSLTNLTTRGVTLHAEASPQAAARGKHQAISTTVWCEVGGGGVKQ